MADAIGKSTEFESAVNELESAVNYLRRMSDDEKDKFISFVSGNSRFWPPTQQLVSTIRHFLETKQLNESIEGSTSTNKDEKINAFPSLSLEAEIFSSKREMECQIYINSDFMINRVDISKEQREDLIDWLIVVHQKLKVREEILHLAIQLMDRFLAAHPAGNIQPKLMGAATLSLACKYEEAFDKQSQIVEGEAFNTQQVIQEERRIANVLSFRFSLPTTCTFLRMLIPETSSHTQRIALFFTELGLVEVDIVTRTPSLLAASAAYTASCTLKGSEDGVALSKLIAVTSYKKKDILELARKLVTLHRDIKRKSAIYLKNQDISAPALFLLNKKRGRDSDCDCD